LKKKNQKTFAPAPSPPDVASISVRGAKQTKVIWFFFSKNNTSSAAIDAAPRKSTLCPLTEPIGSVRRRRPVSTPGEIPLRSVRTASVVLLAGTMLGACSVGPNWTPPKMWSPGTWFAGKDTFCCKLNAACV